MARQAEADVGITELLTDVTIAKITMSPSGGHFRLWRASKSKRHSPDHPFVLICEIHPASCV